METIPKHNQHKTPVHPHGHRSKKNRTDIYWHKVAVTWLTLRHYFDWEKFKLQLTKCPELYFLVVLQPQKQCSFKLYLIAIIVLLKIEDKSFLLAFQVMNAIYDWLVIGFLNLKMMRKVSYFHLNQNELYC